MSGRNLRAIERDPIEAAAIALAAHRTRLLNLGIEPGPWLEVHEDVRESYRKEVRLVLDVAEAEVGKLRAEVVEFDKANEGLGTEVERLREERDALRDFILTLGLTREQYADFRTIPFNAP